MRRMKKLDQLKKYTTGKAVLVALRRLYNNPRRWVKGVSTSYDGTACCLSGGIANLSANINARMDARAMLKAVLDDRYNGFIPNYNDEHGRTVDQIRETLRKAYKS